MIRLALISALALLVSGAIGAAGLVYAYSRDLPSFEALADYRPPQTTRVYDRNGQPVGEYFRERRTVVPRDRIPEILKKAVVAAEDANFYQHRGLDYLGIARALVQDLRHLRAAQGASTITQQVVKNLVLSPERSLARKVKEAILARRLEQNLSKEEILWLYLNHIYFGHNRYGVEEASRFFFNKPVDQLSLGEAALLAGLPQSPVRLSPLRHPDRAKARQTYVLRQMAENGFITRAQAEAEVARPLALAPTSIESVGSYYLEEARRQLVERYGEQQVYEGGMRVELGMDRAQQQQADVAVRAGLEELDHRFGFRAPEQSVAAGVLKALRAERTAAAAGRAWDFSHVSNEALASAEALSDAIDERKLEPGATVVAPVDEAFDDRVVIDLGGPKGVIPLERMKWARPWSPAKATPAPKRASAVLSPGQLVRVRVLDPAAVRAPVKGKGAVEAKSGDARSAEALVPLALAPVPTIQGALVSIDPATREIIALVGGYDFGASAFNRATQAHRQPGSSFKPFVYAAALASGRFTTASILNDAPELFRDPWTGKEWRPQNFERDEFEGPMSLREALAKSKNTVSVRLIEAIGPEAVIDLARKAGISSTLPENMTLALGTGEVTPVELANGYTTFAALGKVADPILIARVTDASGRVLEEHRAAPEERVPPAIAFIVTSLMQSVVESGTGVQAQQLHRPVAAKTGTTSDHRDAWFSGFTPELVTTVWVGFDDSTAMASSETGARAALPIWLDFMKRAFENRPVAEFTVPPEVEQVRIDPKTGLRSPDETSGRLEFFVEGTAPTDFAPNPGEASPEMMFLEDAGRGR